MDAKRKQTLLDAGINVDGALERFMGNESMLEKYLGRFLNEKSYAALDAAIKSNDQQAAAAAAHTLKSVCGTIGCDGMRELLIAQEADMRAGKWDEAVAAMAGIEDCYHKICSALQAG